KNITAYNCTVNPNIVKNPYELATAYTKDYETAEGIDKQDLISDMVDLRDKRLYLAGTADDCFQGMISAIGVNTSSAKSMEINFENIGQAISNQRLSVSGVDEDEEAMNLVKYQAAYELAAKAMSVMAEILDKLINGTAL
ncbi:MAG: flagellar hook-associated protein FlgK, partial [Lachnospiraceae bacterium]|nr:flagellar hook-associated protein FlgK [Lachnospiraceae bacterium]